MPTINRAYVVNLRLDASQIVNDELIAQDLLSIIDELYDVQSVNPFGGDAPPALGINMDLGQNTLPSEEV